MKVKLDRRALAIAVTAAIVVATALALRSPDRPTAPPTPPAPPIAADTGGDYGVTGGLVGNESYLLADIVMINSARGPAQITAIRAIPGGGSPNGFDRPEYFLAGINRAVGSAGGNMRFARSMLKVPIVPAIGASIPGIDKDPSQHGVLILIRVRLHGARDASFDGVEVDYAWQGHDYTFRTPYHVLMCSATGDGELPPPCGDAGNI